MDFIVWLTVWLINDCLLAWLIDRLINQSIHHQIFFPCWAVDSWEIMFTQHSEADLDFFLRRGPKMFSGAFLGLKLRWGPQMFGPSGLEIFVHKGRDPQWARGCPPVHSAVFSYKIPIHFLSPRFLKNSDNSKQKLNLSLSQTLYFYPQFLKLTDFSNSIFVSLGSSKTQDSAVLLIITVEGFLSTLESNTTRWMTCDSD